MKHIKSFNEARGIGLNKFDKIPPNIENVLPMIEEMVQDMEDEFEVGTVISNTHFFEIFIYKGQRAPAVDYKDKFKISDVAPHIESINEYLTSNDMIMSGWYIGNLSPAIAPYISRDMGGRLKYTQYQKGDDGECYTMKIKWEAV